ncbi:MAG: sugar ABC transporter permease [Chloroflexi bacterium HGW-Chloroflexi-10]|nr:MAG: sugar ABC transporter permease [Chloroflexi bacterium HGW-Chloroflexi-10]
MENIQAIEPRPPFFNRFKKAVGKYFWGYFFILPSLLIIILFKLVPLVIGFAISFSDWNLLSSPEFTGLLNYGRLFTDPTNTKVFGNTFYYAALSVPLNLTISLGLAIALNQKIKGLAFFRTAYYIPVVAASVAVSAIWVWLLSDFGMINTFLTSIGLQSVNLLQNTKYALTAITLVDVWKNLGFNVIIFLAALQDVPEELRDAARVDGASSSSIFRHITIPMISPAIFFTAVMGVIGSLQAFDLVFNMSMKHEGGPARATSTVGFYIWQNAFKYSKMGYAAALSFALMAILLILTIIQWRMRRKWVYGEE